MSMKRIIIVFSIIFIGLSSVFAQKPDANKMVQDRLNFMKTNLKLTATESKVFWGAYEQYIRSEVKCFENYRSNLEKKGIKKGCPDCDGKGACDNLTDAQISYMFDQKFELRKNLLNLETSFYKKIKGTLTPKHLQEFYKNEERYKRSLVKNKNTAAQAKNPVATPTKPRR